MSTNASTSPPTLERDPVCGMNLNPATATHVYEHAGKPFYFCSAGCVEKFKADPAKYLNTTPARPSGLVMLVAAKPMSPDHAQTHASPHSATESVYVCPMCPEVREPKPGACPSCGMALEPEIPVASSKRTDYTCPMHPEIVRPGPGSVRSAAWRSSPAPSPLCLKKILNCAT